MLVKVSMEKKIIIIGAGTAGLISAAKLAKAGEHVMVYERKKGVAPISNASGILSISGLKGLGINYKESILNQLNGAVIHFPNISLRIESKKAQAYVIDRTKLNELCRDEAESSGARIDYGKNILGNSFEKLRYNSIIIGADGTVSTVAKHFGFPGINRYLLTYRVEYRIKNYDDKLVELFFDNDLTPGMFGWIAPHGDNIEAGVGIDSRYGNSLNTFRQFISKEKIRRIIKNGRIISKGANIIPIELRKKFVNENEGVMLIGDAAGQVKASTGGGIIFGGNAALLASDAIIRNFDRGEGIASYERKWRQKFGLDMKLHSLINRYYSSLSNKELDLLGRSMKLIGIEGFLSKYGDMDMPSVMLKRFFLRRFAR